MQTLDVMRYGHQEVTAVIDAYRPEDWSRIALGVWTSRDLLGHLGAFEQRIADLLATFVGAPVVTDLLDADPGTFNDDQAAVRADWPAERVIDEYLTAHERVMGHAAAIPDARWRELGTIPWYGADYSLDDLIVYQIYGHKREHVPQLSAALEREA